MTLRQALDGVSVVDFTQMVAGPVCTMLLADMGARVIKVEPPGGDAVRALGPTCIGDDSVLYHAFNRNKQGIVIDLKSAEGAALARRLVARADVVVESNRPGVMARLGLGADELLAAHPGLVYCSISAYGQTGPYAGRAGVDGIVQADSGLMSLLGSPGAAPCKVQAPVVDVMTGYVACIGVLAQLLQRRQGGRGAPLDVNLMNSALALQQASLAAYLADGVLPERSGSAAPYAAPNEALETADGWIMVAAYQGGRWPRLCRALGVPQLADDPRFSSSALRVQHRAAMVDALSAATRTRPSAHWLDVLQAADVLCAPVADYADLMQHPQLAANAVVAAIDDPRHGTIRSLGFPIDSGRTNARPHRAAPARGEHTREVLRGLALDDERIAALCRDGVLRCS